MCIRDRGNDVTLSVDMKNMMGQREKGQAIEEVQANITTTMADQLKDLKYVENYNYTISTFVDSDTLNPIELSASDNQINIQFPNQMGGFNGNSGSFSISANTTMEYLEAFSNEESNLIEGKLLSTSDKGSEMCIRDRHYCLHLKKMKAENLFIYTQIMLALINFMSIEVLNVQKNDKLCLTWIKSKFL